MLNYSASVYTFMTLIITCLFWFFLYIVLLLYRLCRFKDGISLFYILCRILIQLVYNYFIIIYLSSPFKTETLRKIINMQNNSLNFRTTLSYTYHYKQVHKQFKSICSILILAKLGIQKKKYFHRFVSVKSHFLIGGESKRAKAFN